MYFREALIQDILQIQQVRNTVKENTLSDPALVSDADCEDYLFRRGKGWVCEADGRIVGFAIADLLDHNVWALFITPGYEKQGIGLRLHNTMLNWYFSMSEVTLWLSTSPGTRAETFYRKAGWHETGLYGKNEIRFEMEFEQWKKQSNSEPK